VQAHGWWEGTEKDVYSYTLEHSLHLLLVLLDTPTPSSSPQPPLRQLLLNSIEEAVQFHRLFNALVIPESPFPFAQTSKSDSECV
jgi:hypothetical protein